MLRVRFIVVAASLVAFIGLSGCSRDAASTADKDVHASEASGHAPANVVPGSHEDWCEEHQVPESQCTRCNADLIAAFKATGDWCEEHGLPESQCLKCNPELKIVRPPPGSGAGTK